MRGTDVVTGFIGGCPLLPVGAAELSGLLGVRSKRGRISVYAAPAQRARTAADVNRILMKLR